MWPAVGCVHTNASTRTLSLFSCYLHAIYGPGSHRTRGFSEGTRGPWHHVTLSAKARFPTLNLIARDTHQNTCTPSNARRNLIGHAFSRYGRALDWCVLVFWRRDPTREPGRVAWASGMAPNHPRQQNRTTAKSTLTQMLVAARVERVPFCTTCLAHLNLQSTRASETSLATSTVVSAKTPGYIQCATTLGYIQNSPVMYKQVDMCQSLVWTKSDKRGKKE